MFLELYKIIDDERKADAVEELILNQQAQFDLTIRLGGQLQQLLLLEVKAARRPKRQRAASDDQAPHGHAMTKLVAGQTCPVVYVGTFGDRELAYEVVRNHAGDSVPLVKIDGHAYPDGVDRVMLSCGICGQVTPLPVSGDKHPAWSFSVRNGIPSLAPSVNSIMGDPNQPQRGFRRCHYFVTDGTFIALADSVPWTRMTDDT